VICVSFASGYLVYYPDFLRRRNEDDGDAGFFLFAGGDQEDSDVNVGILGLLLTFFFPVFTLYTVSFISVLWVSFILPLLVFSFSSPSFSLFHPLSPCSLPFVAFIAREDNAVSSDHKV